MNITLNGEAFIFTSGSSISDLLKTLDLEVEKVAIERNMEILPHSLYDNTHTIGCSDTPPVDLLACIRPQSRGRAGCKTAASQPLILPSSRRPGSPLS